jgi:hypothetical protein
MKTSRATRVQHVESSTVRAFGGRQRAGRPFCDQKSGASDGYPK